MTEQSWRMEMMVMMRAEILYARRREHSALSTTREAVSQREIDLYRREKELAERELELARREIEFLRNGVIAAFGR